MNKTLTPFGKNKQTVIRCVMSIVGTLLLGVCVGLFRKANLGTDPFTTFVLGIGIITNHTYSFVYPIIVGLMVVVIFFINKKHIGLATILNTFVLGPVADFSLNILNKLYVADTLVIQLVTMVFAVILLSFSASIYMTAQLGISTYDAVALMMNEKLPPKKLFEYRFCRIFTDFVCVLLGFLFHAQIGIGTIITAFFMGPIIQFFNKTISEPILYGKD